MNEFIVLIDRARHGTPAGSGWGTYNLDCPVCSVPITVVALVGTKGMTCPVCEATFPEFKFLSNQAGEGSTLLPVGWQHAKLCMN